MPEAGSSSIESQSWTSKTTLDAPEVKTGRRRGDSGPIGALRASNRTLFFQELVWWSSSCEGVGLKARGNDRLDEPTRHADPLGRGPVDGSVQADDPAEGTHGIAFIGKFKGFRSKLSASAAPQGLLCLRIVGGRFGELTNQTQGAVEVEQVIVREFLAVEDLGCGQVRPEQSPAPRKKPRAGAGSRHTGATTPPLEP